MFAYSVSLKLPSHSLLLLFALLPPFLGANWAERGLVNILSPDHWFIPIWEVNCRFMGSYLHEKGLLNN